MASRYRSPILASALRASAMGGVLLTIALGYAGNLAAEAATRNPYFDPAHSQFAAARFSAYLPAVFAAAGTMTIFGVAQLIEYIGRISFNSGLLVEAAERAETSSAARSRDLLAALRAILDAIKKTGNIGTVRTSQITSAERFFYVDGSSRTLGPVAFEDFEQLARDGVLGASTLVCREGDEQWTTLGEIL